MVKFPIIFSKGETGLAYQYFSSMDKEIGCLIIQNFWCDESFAWRARGGSKKIDTISEFLGITSYKDYFLIKTPTQILIYHEDELRMTLDYTGNFDIGAFSAETITTIDSSGTTTSENDTFTIGLYVKDNLAGGVFVDVSGTLKISGSTTNFTINKDNSLIKISNNALANVNTPVGLTKKQFLSSLLYLNQQIYLTIAKDGVQTIEFVGGTTDSTFSYKLTGAYQYKKLVKYGRGFILVGTTSSEVFTTSENSSSSIFTATNIRGFELCIGNIEYIACDDNMVVYSFVAVRDVYIQLIGGGYSSTYTRVHNEISSVRGIQTISGRPQKFMVLYEDGIIDVIYGIQGGDRSFKVINSRLKFYNPVDELINGYAGKLFFRIGNVFQFLTFNSERYLDNWSENFVNIGSLTPFSEFTIRNDSFRNFGTGALINGFKGQKIDYKYILLNTVNTLGRAILKQKFILRNFGTGDEGLNYNNAILNIDTSLVNSNMLLHIDLDFSIEAQEFFVVGSVYLTIQFDGVEVSRYEYKNKGSGSMNYNLKARYLKSPDGIELISQNKGLRSSLDFVLGRFKNTHELVVGNKDEYYDSNDVYFGELIEYVFVTNDLVNFGHQMYGYPKMNPRFLLNTVDIKSIKPVSTTNVRNYVYGTFEYSDNMFKPDVITYDKSYSRTTSWYNWQSMTPAFKGVTETAFYGMGSVEPFDVFMMWTDVNTVHSRGAGS